jgi:2-polyprenyl-3-methyl-5-hydroxy-6-metoxy-1,4-benzoquinol methylase
MKKKSHNKFSYNYTTIRINNTEIKGIRDPLDRLNYIPLSFKNKSVLDLGCNVGGILFALADQISFGTGYDINPNAIETANKIKNEHNLTHLSFNLENLENAAEINFPKADIVFMLSIAVWVPNWKDILDQLDPTTLIFEAHGKEHIKLNQVDFLKTKFSKILLIETPEGDYRNLYLCEK